MKVVVLADADADPQNIVSVDLPLFGAGNTASEVGAYRTVSGTAVGSDRCEFFEAVHAHTAAGVGMVDSKIGLQAFQAVDGAVSALAVWRAVFSSNAGYKQKQQQC